jgi:hypothetical protein
MWIVRLALNRPYTFIVLAILILIAAPVLILRTPPTSSPTSISRSSPSPGSTPASAPKNSKAASPRPTKGPSPPRRQHPAHRVHHLNGEGHRQDLPAARRLARHRQRPGLGRLRVDAQAAAARHPAAADHQLLRLQRAHPAARTLRQGLSEQQLNDYGLNFIRPQLVTVPAPCPQRLWRQAALHHDQPRPPQRCRPKASRPVDVSQRLGSRTSSSPAAPPRSAPPSTTSASTAPPHHRRPRQPSHQAGQRRHHLLKDVASVTDGSIPQTNIVRQDGHRGVLITVLKSGSASTLASSGRRACCPASSSHRPKELKITPIGDQSIFVRASINGVIREGVIAAALTGLMILLFLGSWRSTLIIAVSIPLSILTSIIVLSLLGETINIMTLGGLALAVGILVDDATVTIENIERYLEEGQPLRDAILEGAAQIAVPALVSTLCICIVFLPMFFLAGVARYLFVPLAEAVVFAMLASYILSRTLVPTWRCTCSRSTTITPRSRKTSSPASSAASSAALNRVRSAYHACSTAWSSRASSSSRSSCWLPLALLLIPSSARTSSPTPTTAQFILHVRAKTGTRIEETAALRPRRAVHPLNRSRRTRWTTSSTTSACPTPPQHPARHQRPLRRRRRRHPRLAQGRPHPTADYVAPCARTLPASSPASPSTSCPPTSSPRSSTSACPRPSTSRSKAPTTPATARRRQDARSSSPGPRPRRSPPPAARRLPRPQRHRRPHQGAAGRLHQRDVGGSSAQHPLRLSGSSRRSSSSTTRTA